MLRRSRREVLGLMGVGLGLCLGVEASLARAQVGGAAGTGSTLPGAQGSAGMAAMYANPYTNPYTNPFLNPYMAQGQTTPGNAAVYFFAAQQASGGIGSGRIGGPNSVLNARGAGSRTGNGTGVGVAGREETGGRTRRASDVPGAGASRFFNRGTAAGAINAPVATHYYDRQTRHFPNSGR
jgi:hypothetical protein